MVLKVAITETPIISSPMKRILLLADATSSHTQKWAEAVRSLGFDVMIFSFSNPDDDRYTKLGINLANDQKLIQDSGFSQSDLKKSSYLKHLSKLKKIVVDYKPDLVHAHYATSYGLMAALCGFKPYLVSVWGSDIFDFPKRSFLHKTVLKYNLSKAECVVSSSNVMAEEVKKYFNGRIVTIPFGIDLALFSRKIQRHNVITVGIIKSMEDHYGIESLIKAFRLVKDRFPEKILRLLLIGGGTKIENYRNLAMELGISDVTEFRGKIPQQLVPDAHNEIDIFVNPSVHESFGVSVLEASASGNPVIVTNVGGLKEVVVDKLTGLIVDQGNDEELAKAISYFVVNQEQIDIFGEMGRKFVSEKYDLKDVNNKIGDLYHTILN